MLAVPVGKQLPQEVDHEHLFCSQTLRRCPHRPARGTTAARIHPVRRASVARGVANSRLLQPCSLTCYKSPSVTALSSAAATAKERAGSIPSRKTHSGGSTLLFYFVLGVAGVEHESILEGDERRSIRSGIVDQLTFNANCKIKVGCLERRMTVHAQQLPVWRGRFQRLEMPKRGTATFKGQ